MKRKPELEIRYRVSTVKCTDNKYLHQDFIFSIVLSTEYIVFFIKDVNER